MDYKRPIGIHLRLTDTLYTLIQQAVQYDVNAVQFFLTKLPRGKYIKLHHENIADFLHIKQQSFSNTYVHCSYWINLATENKYSWYTSINLLKKEIRMAKKLKINQLVLHAGSAKGHTKIAGIHAVAKALNKILKYEHDIMLLLENTAHGKKTVGSNLEDFSILKSKLDFPEKIQFCLDLAHGFSYGYDLKNTENFIRIIDKHMGIEHIKLIHVNDSAEQIGSKLDKHAIPGQGYIGKNTLSNIINHETLKNKPIILELPPVETHFIQEAIDIVKQMVSISNIPKTPKIGQIRR